MRGGTVVEATDGKERKNNTAGHNNGDRSDVMLAYPGLSPVCLPLFRTVWAKINLNSSVQMLRVQTNLTTELYFSPC